MLKAKNLCWQQGNKKILDNIDFSLLKGEVIGLVGAFVLCLIILLNFVCFLFMDRVCYIFFIYF